MLDTKEKRCRISFFTNGSMFLVLYDNGIADSKVVDYFYAISVVEV